MVFLFTGLAFHCDEEPTGETTSPGTSTPTPTQTMAVSATPTFPGSNLKGTKWYYVFHEEQGTWEIPLATGQFSITSQSGGNFSGSGIHDGMFLYGARFELTGTIDLDDHLTMTWEFSNNPDIRITDGRYTGTNMWGTVEWEYDPSIMMAVLGM